MISAPRDGQTLFGGPEPASTFREIDQPHAIAVSVNVRRSHHISLHGVRTRSRHSGLGQGGKQNANFGVAAGVSALGTEAELEGKRARAFPLHFVDRAVSLGPLKVVDVPPLF
jgi:hypothetical protein